MHGCSTRKSKMAFLSVAYFALVCSETVQAQVKLEYKFVEGKKLIYKTTVKKSQNLSFMGMEIRNHEQRTIIESFTIGNRRADLTLPIETKVESLRAEISLPGEDEMTYDTTDPKATINAPGFAFLGDILKLNAEAGYTVVLDGNNKVKAIEGTDALQEKIGKLDPRTQDLVRGEFEAETFKKIAEQRFQFLPDVLARQGEPWERTEILEIGDGRRFILRKKYEYRGTEKREDKTFDKITWKVLEVKLSMDPNSKLPLKTTKSDLKVESSDGTILFDRNEGQIASSKEKLRCKGDQTLSAQGTDVPSVVELSIETNVELQAKPR